MAGGVEEISHGENAVGWFRRPAVVHESRALEFYRGIGNRFVLT